MDPSIEQHLQGLEERLLQPEVRISADKVAALLAEDFIEFGSSGRVFDKQRIIEHLQAEPQAHLSLVDFKTVQPAPGVVLATYRATQQGIIGEQPTYSLRSSVWRLTGDRWQIVFHQGTLSEEG